MMSCRTAARAALPTAAGVRRHENRRLGMTRRGVDQLLDDFGRESRKSFKDSFGKAVLGRNVLSLDVPKLLHPPPERFYKRRVTGTGATS